MADPEDPAKKNANAYAKASESYAKAMDAEAKKTLAEGAAAAKIADKAAKAPPPGSREAMLGAGVGPNGLPLNQPGTVPIPSNPAAPVTPMGGVNLSAVKPGPAAPVVPDSVQQYQDTIEAKRAGLLGYDPKAAAAAVPPEVDKYQAAIEAPRVLPQHSMGLPGDVQTAPAPAPTESAKAPSSAAKKSAVDQIIENMKAELGDEKNGPNFWDILQAAAAGWNLQTPAYVEKQRKRAEQQADIEKLSKTAQFEKALQEEREASESARSDKEIQARKDIAAMELGKSAAPLAGLSAGSKLGVGLLQGIGKVSKTAPIVVPPKTSGGAH